MVALTPTTTYGKYQEYLARQFLKLLYQEFPLVHLCYDFMKKKKMSKNNHDQVKSIFPDLSKFKLTLRELAEQRRGGAINITGLEFQFLYAANLLLNLTDDNDDYIRLEGVEDIDIIQRSKQEYIQVKTSENKIDASDFLALNVLQNFLIVYKIDSKATFKVVHNTKFAKGMLDVLHERKYTDKGIEHWRSKLPAIINDDELRDFFSKISFEHANLKELENSLVVTLHSHYNINAGTEQPFIRSLFYMVFQWSKKREIVSKKEIDHLFQAIKDSFGKFPDNPAIKFRWIVAVDFEESFNQSDLSYFEGKAAKPSDIARGLPVNRPSWKKMIENSLEKFDVTLVKSSSGQGKSTLAWMVGLASKSKSYSVYQLAKCSNHEEAVGIVEFLETRLAIGELPLVIIDGLGSLTSSWHFLPEQFRGKHVKFIVTSREEDWTRYGNDVSRFSLNVVDIVLSIREAREIYLELKRRNRIHQTVQTWQPAWEQISEKGLLIEYVFLLTQGQMIEDRLMQQIKVLGLENDSGAKLEILRLISLADVLNVRVNSRKLIMHVQRLTPFSCDRNELFRQLEREYYIKFTNDFVEGLHPVRSRHLVDILLSHLSPEDSLLALLNIIDEDAVYDFFVAAPHFFTLSEGFYAEVAKIVATRSYKEMVAVIDGLMHSEPLYYWIKNREIFDAASKVGGLSIFLTSTIPLNPPDVIENLTKSLGDNAGGLRVYSDLLKKLTPYSFEFSSVNRFTQKLLNEVQRLPKTKTYSGIFFLVRWFKAFGLEFPDIVDLSEGFIMETIRNKSISESEELVRYYYEVEPQKYRAFISRNRNEIFSILKIRTDTPSISEFAQEINLTYLVDHDMEDINGNSVKRIETFRAFFPEYLSYNTCCDILPFPNEAIISYSRQAAVKNIAPENLGDEFILHINKIWISVIAEKYKVQSSFEWQKCHFEIRRKIVQLNRTCIKLLEAVLEKKVSKALTLNREFVKDGNDYILTSKVASDYPTSSTKVNQKAFQSEDNLFNSYYSYYSNFIKQFLGLVDPKESNDQHHPVMSMKLTIEQLTNVQGAFNKVAIETQKYFDTLELEQKEILSFRKLSETVQYFVYYTKSATKENVLFAERSVHAWIQQSRQNELGFINNTLSNLHEKPFFFTFPTEVLEIGVLKYVTIGLQFYDPTNENEVTKLFTGLIDIIKSGVHFFNFVIADDNKNVKGAFRLSNNFFERIKKMLEGVDDDDDVGPATPMPINVNDPTVILPSDFNLPSAIDQASTHYFKMMAHIWKLNEYRSRLDGSNILEQEWLKKLEESYGLLIRSDFSSSKTDGLEQVQQCFVEDFLSGKLTPSPTEIVQLMLEHSAKLAAR